MMKRIIIIALLTFVFTTVSFGAIVNNEIEIQEDTAEFDGDSSVPSMSYVITNMTDHVMKGINFQYYGLDKDGTIVDSTAAYPNVDLQGGQSVKTKFFININEGVVSLQVYGYRYDDENDQRCVETFPEMFTINMPSQDNTDLNEEGKTTLEISEIDLTSMSTDELIELRNSRNDILGEAETEERNAEDTALAEEIANEEGLYSITAGNILEPLYDKDGIKVTVSSCTHDTSKRKPEYEMVLLVENNSDQKVGAYLSGVYFNGYSISSYGDMKYIDPGKTGLCESSIYDEDLEPYGIEDVESIECDIVLSSGLWSTAFDYIECKIDPIVFALNIKNGEMQGISDREIVQKVQEALNKAGFECGTPDGIAGSNTSNAIKEYQEKNGLSADGIISYELLQALDIYE